MRHYHEQGERWRREERGERAAALAVLGIGVAVTVAVLVYLLCGGGCV